MEPRSAQRSPGARRPDLSVVVPLLDERDTLEPLHDRIQKALAPLGCVYEVVYVDDGSRDGSFDVLRKLHERFPEVCVVQLRRNFGKAAAYQAGFERARGETIVTLDADLQDAPEEIPSLLAVLDDSTDLVCGWRRRRADARIKVWLSRGFNLLARALLGTRLHDLNCGLRVFRRELVRDLALYGELHRFIPVLAQAQGYRIAEVEVRHYPRAHTASRYGIARLPKGLLDLVTVFFLGHFRDRPLHLFGGLGLALGTAGLAIDAYVATLWLRFGDIQSRHPLLLLGILLTVLGVQLVCTGLLAELLTQRTRSAGSVSVRRILD